MITNRTRAEGPGQLLNKPLIFWSLMMSPMYSKFQQKWWDALPPLSHVDNMMTSSNGHIFRVTDPLCGEFTGHRWILRTKASDVELWCLLWSATWINGWVNNREGDDLRRHRAHYDVIVINGPRCNNGENTCSLSEFAELTNAASTYIKVVGITLLASPIRWASLAVFWTGWKDTWTIKLFHCAWIS